MGRWLQPGPIDRKGTPEELAANPIVREKYLGRDFELKKKTRVDI
jgi:lipopolysaccharide export system ATP-binding protein